MVETKIVLGLGKKSVICRRKREKVKVDNCQAGLDYSAQQIIKCRPCSVQGDRKVKVETQNIFMNNFSK